MKKIFVFFALVLSKFALAQAPQQINYQGVARNAQGQAIANQPVKVRVSLIKENDVNVITTFYTETRTVTTNALGLFSFQINGDGASNVTGFLANGSWNDNNTIQSLKVELDVNNSGTWTNMGTQKIVSVPYALYASEAASAREISTPLVAFNATSTSGQTINANAAATLIFESQDAQSTGFNLANNSFTAPTSGWYHFDLNLIGQWQSGPVAAGQISASFTVDGVGKRSAYATAQGTLATLGLNSDIYLVSGQKLVVVVSNLAGVTGNFGAAATSFNGHLIR